ncbi:hypothetical protein CLOSTMETH_02178 [[Clostridium] methylpentosum DSM 5476]|uniref:Uncharacterized protein n=1 Tax=[Clostridium] methylpentosum DSM 5476 TaxID=537013 RepID=C0EE99_9FIRM|nr:hypothetical protein CLOSTMETH_02178 [[Clostridium] methylpentosum DSM 5476]
MIASLVCDTLYAQRFSFKAVKKSVSFSCHTPNRDNFVIL